MRDPRTANALALTNPGESLVHIDPWMRPPSTSCNVHVPSKVRLNSRRGEENALDTNSKCHILQLEQFVNYTATTGPSAAL